jgi:3-oxoadipate enol-lactonase
LSRRWQAQRRFIGVEALAYDLTGPPDAPVLVLGSSVGTTRAMWQPQLDALTTDFRVLRFDHLGHGESPVPPGPYRIDDLGQHLVRLLDQLELARVSYAGLSLGGMVGMWLAAYHPERVDRLALLCTSAHLPPAEGWLRRARTVREEGLGAIVDQVLGRWFTPGFADRQPAVVQRLAAAFTATPAEGYAGCCEALAALDLRPVLADITAPTLVVAGADDPATPPPHGQLIADAITVARLEVLPDAAHLASVERADAVNDLLLGHLK